MLKTKHVPLLMDFLLSFCVSAFQCNEKLIFLLQNHRCIAFPAVMIIKKNYLPYWGELVLEAGLWHLSE